MSSCVTAFDVVVDKIHGTAVSVATSFLLYFGVPFSLKSPLKSFSIIGDVLLIGVQYHMAHQSRVGS